MGTCVIGGMLAASILAIFLIPVTFYVVERLRGAVKKNPDPAESARNKKQSLEL